MDANITMQLVSTLGFPICCCLALMWYVKYVTDKHTEEIKQLTEAINNNTIVVTKLCEKVDKD